MKYILFCLIVLLMTFGYRLSLAKNTQVPKDMVLEQQGVTPNPINTSMDKFVGDQLVDSVDLYENSTLDTHGHVLYQCTKENKNIWQLPLLNTVSRKRMIAALLVSQGSGFVLKNGSDPNKCDGLLSKLISFNGVKLLSPAFTSKTLNEDLVKKIAPTCTSLELERVYKSSNGGGIGKGADIKHKNDGEAKGVKGFVETTANFEYYDLSEYLGADSWGFFSEGARMVDPSFKDHNMICGQWYGSIHKVFNSRTCQSSQDPSKIVGRIMFHYKGPNEGHIHQLQSVYAFLGIDSDLYRLILRESYGSLNSPKVVIDIDKITMENEGNELAFGNECDFEVSNRQKEIK